MKGINPDIVQHLAIKYVKDVSCVDNLSIVLSFKNVQLIGSDLPVGPRLHQFWQKWAALEASHKVIAVLKKGYTLPFWIWPNLTRSLTIISWFVNRLRHSCHMETFTPPPVH